MPADYTLPINDPPVGDRCTLSGPFRHPSSKTDDRAVLWHRAQERLGLHPIH